MSSHPCFLRWMSLPLATVLGVAWAMTVGSEVLGGEAARLDGFTQSDGNSVFALHLRPSVPAANGPRDVVILVSTAASQTGDYRATSLATLQSVLAKLGANDRVKLVAFDLNATPLTPGFVAPNSPQMTAALGALNQRTPLGSCDLEKALDSAANGFSGESKSARAIVYIGDGSSRANALTPEQLDHIVNDLVAQRTPVIAFGVGPRVDEQTLGILASRSGGVVVLDQAAVDAADYGTLLAQAVHGSVLWPKAGGTVKWPEGMDVYPKAFPPMRSDRDTVLVGSEKSTAAKQVKIDMDGPAGGQELVWDIPALKSEPRNAYLATVVDEAKVDGGRTLPLIDSASLAEGKQEIVAGGRGLKALALDALKVGNLESADRLASEVLRRNPSDLNAQNIMAAIKDAAAKKGGAAPAAASGPLPPVPAPAAADVNTPAGSPGDINLQGNNAGPLPDGAAAASAVNENNALEGQWEKGVQTTIDAARGKLATNPDAAKALIRQKISDLTGVSDLRAEVRDRLMRMLQTANTEINHRAEEITFREQQRQREEMSRREMEMNIAELQRDKNKVSQLMERYNSLLDEAHQRLSDRQADKAFADAEVTLSEATKIVERDMPSVKPVMIAAMHHARSVEALEDIIAVRNERVKKVIDTFYQVEKSQIPFADEPPLVYPDAEVWKELTARRKKWSRHGTLETQPR